jgi:glucokinase
MQSASQKSKTFLSPKSPKREPTMSDSNANKSLSIGFDLGGTNLRASLYENVDSEQYTELASVTQEVGEPREPNDFSDRVTKCVSRLRKSVDADAVIPVGIGFAGMLRGHEGMVANSPYYGWRNVDFGQLLQSHLGEISPVRIYNDVNAIAYGEYAHGAGVGAEDVLAVFVGTGIGAGAVCAGKLLTGSNNTAAELGHTKVVSDANARLCACGHKGCIEAYVGGQSLQDRIRHELAQGINSEVLRLAGAAGRAHPGHLDAAASIGDDYALKLYSEIAPLMGLVLANAVTILNPKRLILGGGMFSRTPILREHSLTAFETAVNPPAREGLEIVEAKLGDEAGRVGSALLALRELS